MRHFAWALLLWVPAMIVIRQFMPDKIGEEHSTAAGAFIFFGGLIVAIGAGILLS